MGDAPGHALENAEAWPLIGHTAAEQAFIEAFDTKRLHHGWMIEGPSGIGKSVLAYRIAAYVLGAQCASGTLQSSVSDPVAQKILAEAHPDLRWISRKPDEKGKLKQDISVDAIRGLTEFFALKPALGGWRVGVIDSIDELNRSGANALLKTLEEPPENSLLILISHRTQKVLPTIKSRCRMLRLDALSDADTRAVLDGVDHDMARESTTLQLARGRPGYGLRLASPAGLAAANAARTYLRGLPKPSDAAVSDVLARGGVDEIAFEAFSHEVLNWLSEKSAERPHYAGAWLAVSRHIASVSELNMDRGQATAKLAAILQGSIMNNIG